MRDYFDEIQRIVDEVRISGGGLGEVAEKPAAARLSGWKWHSFYMENLEFLFRRESKTSQRQRLVRCGSLTKLGPIE